MGQDEDPPVCDHTPVPFLCEHLRHRRYCMYLVHTGDALTTTASLFLVGSCWRDDLSGFFALNLADGMDVDFMVIISQGPDANKQDVKTERTISGFMRSVRECMRDGDLHHVNAASPHSLAKSREPRDNRRHLTIHCLCRRLPVCMLLSNCVLRGRVAFGI